MTAAVVGEDTQATAAAAAQMAEFKQQVSSALTIFLGTSKALHEKVDTLDPARRRELTSLLVRKAEELQDALAPVLKRL